MYQKIEEEFKIKSIKNKHALLFLVYIIACIILLTFVLYELNYNDYRLIVAAFIGVMIIYLITYCYIFIKVIKSHKLSMTDMINIENIINIFKADMQEADVFCIDSLIKANGITTKEDVKEALRHYQSLLPRKVISNGALISILAFSISVLSFIYSSKIGTLQFNIELVGIIACIIIILYFLVKTLNDRFFKTFGRYTLYERIEAALSIIYFSYSSDKDECILDRNKTIEIISKSSKEQEFKPIETNIINDNSPLIKIEQNSLDNVNANIIDEDKSANHEGKLANLKITNIDAGAYVSNRKNEAIVDKIQVEKNKKQSDNL